MWHLHSHRDGFCPEVRETASRWSPVLERLVIAFLFCSAGLVLTAFQESSKPIKGEGTSEQARPQPIPFSHKLHSQFVRDCFACHEMPKSGSSMAYPPEEKCVDCHRAIKTDSPFVKKLAEYYEQKKSVPWVPIYRVPDYVYFSHKVHFKNARIACEACHGPVAERDIITKEKATTMVACMDCHRDRGAPVRCNTCHNPHP
jgi:hypothetical protein